MKDYIQFHITGESGKDDLSLDNFDIRELIKITENAERLLNPAGKKDRPKITLQLKSGSVVQQFNTSPDLVHAFHVNLMKISTTNSLDVVPEQFAATIEDIYKVSKKEKYNFNISSSVPKSATLNINPESRFEPAKKETWVDAEFYLYGKVINAGGKEKSGIKLDTEEYGTIIISTPKQKIEKVKENFLYKNTGIEASGKQHSKTGETDLSSLKFIRFVEYLPDYDEDYLNELIEKSKKGWGRIKDKTKILRDIRGDYHE